MNNKIPALLTEYERQSKSPDTEKSSLAYATRQFTKASEAEQNFQRLKEKLFRRYPAGGGLVDNASPPPPTVQSGTYPFTPASLMTLRWMRRVPVP